MTQYIIRRLLLMLVALIGISVAVFSLTYLPGGPVDQRIAELRGMGTEGGVNRAEASEVTKREIELLERYYGLDQHPVVRYFQWAGNVIRLDFGESWLYRRPVMEVIAERFPISLTFGVVSLLAAYIISIPLGIYKARKNGTFGDAATSSLVLSGYIIPGFALGVLLLTFFGGGQFLNWFPSSGYKSEDFDLLPVHWKFLDYAHHMFLPLVCYIAGEFAFLTLLMKNSLLEEMNKDYVRTAMAKGTPFEVAVWKHALRNALIPIVTGIGGIFTIIFSGSLLIERVFDIPGMGLLTFESIVGRDYPIVLGSIMIISVLTLLGRLFADIMYVVVDPRIRLD